MVSLFLNIVVFLILFVVAVIGVTRWVNKREVRDSETLVESIENLRQRPLDEAVRQEFWQTIQSVGDVDEQTSADAYKTALDILAENPHSAELRTLALDVGIWHYSRMRLDNKPTAHDEKAIVKDVLDRAK